MEIKICSLMLAALLLGEFATGGLSGAFGGSPDPVEIQNAQFEKDMRARDLEGSDEDQGPSTVWDGSEDFSDSGVGCVDDCLEPAARE